jgi:hypothetical protein
MARLLPQRGQSIRSRFPRSITGWIEEADTHIDGACHCGAVTFSADIDPARVMLCHCAHCQVMSGSAFRIVVLASIEAFAIRGKTTSYVKVADSGNRRAQVFCPECGTPLYATAQENATSVSIRLGCVRQRDRLRPFAQIWQHSALPWIHELAAVTGSPEQQALLSAPERPDRRS